MPRMVDTDMVSKDVDPIQLALMRALLGTDVWVRLTDPGQEDEGVYGGNGHFYAKGRLLKVTAGSAYGLVEFPEILLPDESRDNEEQTPEEEYTWRCAHHDARGKKWFAPERIYGDEPNA